MVWPLDPVWLHGFNFETVILKCDCRVFAVYSVWLKFLLHLLNSSPSEKMLPLRRRWGQRQCKQIISLYAVKFPFHEICDFCSGHRSCSHRATADSRRASRAVLLRWVTQGEGLLCLRLSVYCVKTEIWLFPQIQPQDTASHQQAWIAQRGMCSLLCRFVLHCALRLMPFSLSAPPSSCPTIGASSSSSSYPSVPPPIFTSPHFHPFLSAQQHLTSYPPGYPPAMPIWMLQPPPGSEWYTQQRRKNER